MESTTGIGKIACESISFLMIRRYRMLFVNDPYIPKMLYDNNIEVPKPEELWTPDEDTKWGCDWKAENMLISALSVDEYYRISHCKTAKEIWDTLDVTFEGTNDVKQSKTNALTQEFELFRMKDGETIADMQKRIIYLINRLHGLGNTFSNKLCTNKILRCLSRE
ncbi:hypothetical protein A2U01_0017077 [Trifolium medium]|uniref:Gag-pol polyprotein n=1 Tax=Trifolium medium TaxID=97028 RepID=A0A392NC57_9FABA|nr:hypothetical protein [Trifolium medium]